MAQIDAFVCVNINLNSLNWLTVYISRTIIRSTLFSAVRRSRSKGKEENLFFKDEIRAWDLAEWNEMNL